MSTLNLLSTLRPAEHGDVALVLLSGGQDSTTCLYWALRYFPRVEAIGFHYGQKHAVELEQARQIAQQASVSFTIMDLQGLLRGSALIEHGQDVSAAHPMAPHLPASFVPGRNVLFLTLAASYGFTRGIHDLVGGMSQTDYSGYPDCRRPFIEAMEQALSLALDTTIRIHTPLMHLTKAETWRLARELDILDVIVELTHTDYHGDRSERHPWGYGRLDNPASILRARGYEEAKARGWLD